MTQVYIRLGMTIDPLQEIKQAIHEGRPVTLSFSFHIIDKETTASYTGTLCGYDDKKQLFHTDHWTGTLPYNMVLVG